ncbi:unconventional myosin-ih [Limosa lapponica baueri]|uniref:Unconventional myosin-ih n=1 Tax=Limosa lapponica baueri TaxID=1758121 RepID=A0A2I0T940_LIMLA|nr:unconventional myosin-ih [Limosa lapponica baueri]
MLCCSITSCRASQGLELLGRRDVNPGNPYEENDINPKVLQLIQGEKIKFRIGSGKEGTMVFTVGQEPQVFKAKNGQLTVVSTQTRS